MHQPKAEMPEWSHLPCVTMADLRQPLENLLGLDVFDATLRGGPFGLEEQRHFARAIYGYAFVRSDIPLEELVSRRKQMWDSCQPWTECLARYFDAFSEELLFQFDQLGLEAHQAEAELVKLSPLERLVVQHIKPAGGTEPASNGREKIDWEGLLRALDLKQIRLEDELKGKARETLMSLRRKGIAIPSWEAAYASKGHTSLEDGKEHTIRREVQKALSNAQRNATRRLGRVWSSSASQASTS